MTPRPGRRVGVVVARPQEEVFDYLADPRNRPQWQASLRRVEVDGDGPPRIGLRWRDHTVVGLSFDLAIVELRRASLWVEQGSSGPFDVTVALSFAPVPGKAAETATAVGCEVRIAGRGWARPLGPPAVLAALATARSDLRRAARVLESA